MTSPRHGPEPDRDDAERADRSDDADRAEDGGLTRDVADTDAEDLDTDIHDTSGADNHRHRRAHDVGQRVTDRMSSTATAGKDLTADVLRWHRIELDAGRLPAPPRTVRTVVGCAISLILGTSVGSLFSPGSPAYVRHTRDTPPGTGDPRP